MGTMIEIKDLIKIPRQAPHELSASVNEIERYLPFNKKYGRGYWLRIVKKSNKSFGEVCYLLGKMNALDKKYNKGGWLTNKFKI